MNSDNYTNLLEFITDKRRMRMSHIYQPVMSMTLLRNGGKASVEQIAMFVYRSDCQCFLNFHRKNLLYRFIPVQRAFFHIGG